MPSELIEDREYEHPSGCRDNLQASVLPVLRQGLLELVSAWEQDRLKLAAGVDWQDGQYRPPGWAPFNPYRYLGKYILQNKPSGPGEWTGAKKDRLAVQHQSTSAKRSEAAMRPEEFLPPHTPWTDLDLNRQLQMIFWLYESVYNKDHKGHRADAPWYMDMHEVEPLMGSSLLKEWNAMQAAADIGMTIAEGHPVKLTCADFVEVMLKSLSDMQPEKVDKLMHTLASHAYIKAAGSVEHWIKNVFEVLDFDNNGKLVFKELESASHSLYPGSEKDDKRIEATLRFLDKDNSQDVSTDEFVSQMGSLLKVTPNPYTLYSMLLDMGSYLDKLPDEWREAQTHKSLIRSVLDMIPSELAQHAVGLEHAWLANHVSPDKVMSIKSEGRRVLAIDLRSEEERAVSTLPDAVAMELIEDPAAMYGYKLGDTDAVQKALAAAGTVALLVAYDTVGKKGIPGAILLSRLLGQPVYNLCGGIFAYYNAGGLVTNPNGTLVEKVHPGADLALTLLILRTNKYGLDESSDEEVGQ